MSLFEEVKHISDLFPEMGSLDCIAQLSKHYYDVKDDNKLVFPMSAELKEDGVYGTVVVWEGSTYLFGRSGQRLTNVGFIAARFAKCPDGTYHGEVVNDNWTLEKLAGATSPARVNPLDQVDQLDLLYYGHIRLFDFLSIKDFRAGKSTLSHQERQAQLLCNNLSSECAIKQDIVYSVEEMRAHAAELIARGYEGGCYKTLTGDWRRARRDGKSLKIVAEVKFDLRCVRVEEGKGKRQGMVANMFFAWKDGKELKADLGKGYSDKDRIALYLDPPIGKIYKVTAMKESSVNGLLRKAKVAELREDKTVADF